MRHSPSFNVLLLCASLGLLNATCASAQAPAAAPAAAIGKPAPDFSLQDITGKAVTLSALRGKMVVLEWFNPDCPFVRHAHTEGPLKDFAQRVASDTLVWLSINSSAPGKQGHGAERNRQAKAEYGIPNTILLDETGKVGRAYGAIKTPHLFVVDAKGVLVYRGGLDNAPVGKVDGDRPTLPGTAADAYEPYLLHALGDLKAGKPLRLPDTPPYGCTVKYGD